MKKIIKEQLKKIKDLDTLSEMKEYIDNEMKTREQVISLCNEANSLKNANNFSFIKESMEKISSNLFKTKAGRNIIDKYINEVKSNKTLSSIHSLCEGLRKIKDARSVNDLIKEWKTSSTFNLQEYKSGVKKLGEILAEGYIVSEIPIDEILNEETIKYNSAIMNIVEGSRSKRIDYGNYFNNIELIAEHVSKRDNSKETELEEAINKFDEKYKNSLQEDEKDIVIKNAVNEDKETFFNSSKSDCLKKLSEALEKMKNEGDFEGSGRVELFIEGVEKKKYNEETVNEDIVNFNELSKCFD